MQLNQIVQACQQFVNQHDDDLVDRYNHRVTAIFLAIFIAVIATKQYYGEPIVWLVQKGIFLSRPSFYFDCNFFFFDLVGPQLNSQERIMLMRILFGNNSPFKKFTTNFIKVTFSKSSSLLF
jgi:hypothetical protein